MTSNNQQAIPVTIFTGFLGAGKTTLVERILKSDHGKKFLLIVNDVGKLNIDEMLLNTVQAAGQQMRQLSNGCICCDLQGELRQQLAEMAAMNTDPNSDVDFNHVIVETTGLAVPGPLGGMFAFARGVKDNYRLDGIVTVVAADAFADYREHDPDKAGYPAEDDPDKKEIWDQQVAGADVLIFSMADIASNDDMVATRKFARSINQLAPIHLSKKGDVPLQHVLDVQAATRDWLGYQHDEHEHVHHDHVHEHTHDHGHDHHHHDGQDHEHHHHDSTTAAFASIPLETDQAVDLDRFKNFLGEEVLRHSRRILRSKGVLYTADDPRRVIVQTRAAGKADISFGDVWTPDSTPRSAFVIIGKRDYIEENRDRLIAGFEACLVTAHFA